MRRLDCDQLTEIGGPGAESRLREIDGYGIFFICSWRPINSVFEGLRYTRFEVIQEEICLTTCRR